MPHMGQVAAALAFMAVVAVVYVVAAGVAGRWLWRRIRRCPASKVPPWRRRLGHSAVVLAGLGLLCMAYGRFIEPTWLEVTRTELEMADLPPGAEPIRIFHLTDTHCEGRPLLEQRVLEVARDEQPDVIVFTGDAVSSREGLERFRELMAGLAEVAPTYAVRGNWDTGRWSDLLFDGTGVVELTDEAATVELPGPGRTLRLLGLSPGRSVEADLPAIAQSDPGDLVVALHHYPSSADKLPDGAADLCLAGHTHGGQVALPVVGPLITLSPYASGLYRTGDRWLYVSRGVGMEGGRAPRVRFLARPEVAMITLRPAPGPPPPGRP